MFGVQRWSGNGVQDITEAAAQARLEAWKRKAKEREDAKRRQEGLQVDKREVVETAPSGSKRESKHKSKRANGISKQALHAVDAKRYPESNGVKSASVPDGNAERSREKGRNRGLATDKKAKLPESSSPQALGAATRKVLPASNGAHTNGKGGATPKSKPASQRKAAVIDAGELEARKAAEAAREERREVKRRKEVERAHEIIAKKAKKARKEGVVAPVLPIVDFADETDEERARAERRRLKRQKREERRRREKASSGDAEGEAGRDEQEMEEAGGAGHTSVAEEDLEEAGVQQHNAEGTERASALESEAVDAKEHRKRKRRKAEGVTGEEKPSSLVADRGVFNEDGVEHTQQASALEEEGLPESPELTAERSGSLDEHPAEGGEDDPPKAGEATTAQAKKPEAPVKGPPLLPWMRAPTEIGEDEGLELGLVPGLDERLKGALERTGIAGLFPVQAAVWKEMVASGAEDHDLCVCAPTGSGKTFAYALPICQGLSQRIVRRLRALVVLPTRDLASQVKAVFDLLAPSLGLSIGLAVGQTSLAGEAQQLVSLGRSSLRGSAPDGDPALAESNVDVLVCTPGRLMDHVHDTPGFTLQHLRYLVVDETDRLLRQAYQDWLPIVLAAASASDAPGHESTIRRPIPERGIRTSVPRVVKLVLSATLTRDPAKIQQLQLHRPRYVATSATDHRYKVPPQLQEARLVCTAGEKPLYLVALLRQLKGERTIVFTASVEATHRLFTLLQAFEGLPVVVGEYSSLQPQRARGAVLEAFRRGDVSVLVSSDAMTRGMDVEGVENVVSYDAPVYAKTYVHRAGRTARAGRSGRCFTLLRKEEVRHFKGLLRKVDNNFCPDYPLPPGATKELVPSYSAALEKLKETVAGESAGGGGTQR